MVATLVCATLIASWNDYRRHRVPNWLNASLLAAGLAVQGLFAGWPGIRAAMGGMFVGMAPLLVLWLMKGMGAGDVKFMAAIGAWLGPRMTLEALLVGGLAGGVMALAMIAARRNWRQTVTNVGLVLSRAGGTSSTVFLPYAIPLSIGTLVVAVSNYLGYWRVL